MSSFLKIAIYTLFILLWLLTINILRYVVIDARCQYEFNLGLFIGFIYSILWNFIDYILYDF